MCGVCVRGAKLKPDLGPRSRKPPDLQIAAAIYFGRRVDNFCVRAGRHLKQVHFALELKGIQTQTRVVHGQPGTKINDVA